ncbi:MAG: carboxylesterase family protein, partial [candidate division WOR-3 bacterium]
FDELRAKISATVKGLDAKKVIHFYREKLRKEKKEPEAWRIYSEFMTHTFFLIPSLKFAERWASFGNPVFVYLFTWPSPYLSGILGACHTLELGFIFGNYDERFFGSGKKAKELSEKMQDSWTSFAKTSDPSCESLGIWESYGSSRNIMVLGERCYLTRDPYGDLLSFYEGS